MVGPAWNATRKVSRRVLTMRVMNIQLDCPWCDQEADFEIREADDDLVCGACGTRTAFAPDPVVTYSLLYDTAQVARAA
jgi:hypothetical protein